MRIRSLLLTSVMAAGLLGVSTPAQAGSGSFYNYRSSVCANSKQAYASQTASFSWDSGSTTVSDWRTTVLSRYCGSSSLTTANRISQSTQFRFGGSGVDCSLGFPGGVTCSRVSTGVVWSYGRLSQDNVREQYRIGSAFRVRGDATSIGMTTDFNVTQGTYTHTGTVQSGPRSI